MSQGDPTMIHDVLATVLFVSIAAAVYQHVGYPVAALAWARLRPRPLEPAPNAPALPRVSVLTACHNEASVIAGKIESLTALDYPDLEIILVSDGSDDGTAEAIAACRDPRVRSLVLDARRGKATALNQAARLATGSVFVISDANTRTRPDAIRALVAPFTDPRVGLTSGHVAVDPQFLASGSVAGGESVYWRYEAMLRRAESAVGSTVGVLGALAAVRRELFGDLPAATVNDDVYLTLRTLSAGYRVLYCPDAWCYRRPSRTMAEERRRRERMTAGRYQVLARPSAWPWRRPQALFALLSHKVLRLAMPLFMIAAAAANLLLLAMDPGSAVYGGLLAAQGGFYALAAFGSLQGRLGLRFLPATIAWYLTSGHLSALVGLTRFLKGGQSVLWQKAHR